MTIDRPASRALCVRILLAAFLSLFSLSCTVNQSIGLRQNASGETRMSITLHQVLVDYLITLVETLEGPLPAGDRRVFDTGEVRRTFAARPAMELLAVTSPSTEKLELSLRFDPLDTVLAAGSGDIGKVFSVTRAGRATTIAFNLNRENFDSLGELFPLFDLGKSLYLFPDASMPMTEEEYLEYVEWALEGVAAGTDIKRVLRESTITIRMEVPGPVVSQKGGRVEGRVVVYSIPVLQVLTLERPVELSVTF